MVPLPMLLRPLTAALLPQIAALLSLVAALIALLGAPIAAAQVPQKIPDFKARVVDMTQTLSPTDVARLDADLSKIESSKGSQVAILVIPTTDPEDIATYTNRVFEQWKLGRGKVSGKSVDDGVLLLIAKNDRKLFIQVGRGLEGAIPDARAKRIITEFISPQFRAGDFVGGLAAGVKEIGRLIEGEALPEPWHDQQTGAQGGKTDTQGGFESVLPVVLFALFGGFALSAVLGRLLGATAGGLGGGFFSSVVLGSPVVGALVGGGLFLALLILGGARSRALPSRYGAHTFGGGGLGGGFGGGFGGGSFGGGGGFGGGSSGGGFSGGGGGESAGGGASGDW